MSIDVKDHRRHLRSVEEQEKAKEQAQPQVLMEQRTIANETGDPRLDKFMRALASKMEQAELHLTVTAMEAMGCIKPEMLLLKQIEFAFTKGRSIAYQEALTIPAQILMEEKGNPNITQ